VRRAANPGVLQVARFCEGRGSGLPDQVAGPEGVALVSLGALLVLEQEGGVLIPGEQPEQQPVRQLEGPCRGGQAQLDQATVLRDGAYILDPLSGGDGDPQEVAAPGAVVLLLLGDRLDSPRAFQSGSGMFDGLRGDGTGRSQFSERTIADRFASMGEQPAYRNSVIVREIQGRPPV